MRFCWFFLGLAVFLANTSALATPWKFGVMPDTQWGEGAIYDPEQLNPNSVAVGVINQINAQFIERGVKFVVQVGDLQSNGSNAALDTRAAFAQPLYNAGIGFYPFRGNHDGSRAAAIEFQRIFPQTRDGGNNRTPADVFTIPNPDADAQPFPAQTGSHFFVGSNFSSPASPGGLAGLTYSFEYNNAQFLLLDQFNRTDGSSSSATSISEQQVWIDERLSARPAGTHAFVFGHKPILGIQTGGLLASDPGQNLEQQNSFISSLQSNGVRYYMCGHDHEHARAMVRSPNGYTQIQQVIAGSNSSIFLIPPASIFGTLDYRYNNRNGLGPAIGNTYPREIPISQQLNRFTFYIFTIDGPRVTVDYYASDPVSVYYASSPYFDYYYTYFIPTLSFTKQESFGYSLNGKEFLLFQGQSYTAIQDSYAGTTAQILSGVNSSTATDYSGRALTKIVDTGWTDSTNGFSSNILSLWGMGNELGSDQTDTFTLSLSYDPASISLQQIRTGQFAICYKDIDGKWVNAVDRNFGGGRNFVLGPWNSVYGLGTYGVDVVQGTAWAVINRNGDFAVTKFNLVPMITASPEGGIYPVAITVMLSTDEPGIIYYTTDGSVPTEGSTVYSSPITISATTTLRFFAASTNGTRTEVHSVNYIMPVNDGFESAVSLPLPYSTSSAVAADFDQDGTVDLAVANYEQNLISIYRSNGDGTFALVATKEVGHHPISVRASYINGNDGYADLVVANEGSDNVTHLFGNGDGTFDDGVNYATGNGTSAAVIGWLNGDGLADMAVTNFLAGNVDIYLASAEGVYEPPIPIYVGAGVKSLAVGNFNGDFDSIPDLAVVNYITGELTVLLGDGYGGFLLFETHAVPVNANAVTAADINGDGKTDLVVVSEDGSGGDSATITMFLGNGDCTFQQSAQFQASQFASDVAIGDYNSDTRADLVLANRLGNLLSLRIQSLQSLGAPVRVNSGMPIFFSSIRSAYATAADGDTIETTASDFIEELSLNRDINLTLQGGFDGIFGAISGHSTLHGSLTISSGTVTVDHLIITE